MPPSGSLPSVRAPLRTHSDRASSETTPLRTGLRQLLLLLVSSRTISTAVWSLTGGTGILVWVQLSLGLLLAAGSLACHRYTRPFRLAFQNTLETFLLASFSLLLLLAFPCHAMSGTDGSLFDVLMTALVLGSLIGGLGFAAYDRRPFKPLSLSDKLIDEPVAKLLGDGTIKLLSCRWLLEEAEAALPRSEVTGLPVLQRRQVMEKEFPAAFVGHECAGDTNEEAVKLFKAGKRQVLVLSYGCAPPPFAEPPPLYSAECRCAYAGLSAAEPDPHGDRLARLRLYLAELPHASECGLFMYHVCLPQLPRTPEEDDLFGTALKKMQMLYASITGTAVIQIKDVPPRPADFDGRLVIHGVPSDLNMEQLKAALVSFGEVRRCDPGLWKDSADVQFATHEQAEMAIAGAPSMVQLQGASGVKWSNAGSIRPRAGEEVNNKQLAEALRKKTEFTMQEWEAFGISDLRTSSFVKSGKSYFTPVLPAVFHAYNDRAYDERGWCCLEAGVAQVVAAQLHFEASLQRLPSRHTDAEASRPKLSLLCDDGSTERHHVVTDQKPAELLQAVRKGITDAEFTAPADQETVPALFDEFAWMIQRGVEQAVEQQQASQAFALLPRRGRGRRDLEIDRADEGLLN